MSRRRRTLRSLTREERWLLAQAFTFGALFRIALWILPSAHVLRFVARRVEAAAPRASGAGVSVVAWAIRVAGRRIPRSTCLVEALSAQCLLAQNGHTSTLRIGVARNPSGEFAAHAWVEVDGRTVVGAARGMSYTPFPDLIRHLV